MYTQLYGKVIELETALEGKVVYPSKLKGKPSGQEEVGWPTDINDRCPLSLNTKVLIRMSI